MRKTEQYTNFMKVIAMDDSHGYDQQYRWNERGDFDCSSLVITALESAGIPVRSYGATYTGNLYDACIKCGFTDVTNKVNLTTGSGLQNGDILLNHAHHVAVYADGKRWEASINEKGTVTGGQPGDQTGTEIWGRPYFNYPWNCVLRLTSDYGINHLVYHRAENGVTVLANYVMPGGEGRFRWKLYDINKHVWYTYVEWTDSPLVTIDEPYADHLIYCELYDLDTKEAHLIDTCAIGSTLGADLITGTYANTQSDGKVLIGITAKGSFETRMLVYSVEHEEWFANYPGVWATFVPDRGSQYWVKFEALENGVVKDSKVIGFTVN